MDANNITMLVPPPQEAGPVQADTGKTFDGFFEGIVPPEKATDIPALLQQIEKKILQSEPGDFAFVYTVNVFRCYVFGVKNLIDFDQNNAPIGSTVAKAFRSGLAEAQKEIGESAVFAGGVVKLGQWLHKVRPTAVGIIEVGRPFR